jgi:hypothetical protein
MMPFETYKVDTYRETTIYVDGNGRFYASPWGVDVEADTIAVIKKLILKNTKGDPIVALKYVGPSASTHRGSVFEEVKVTGVRPNGDFISGQRTIYGTPYKNNASALAEVSEAAEAYLAAGQRLKAALEAAAVHKLTPDDLKTKALEAAK